MPCTRTSVARSRRCAPRSTAASSGSSSSRPTRRSSRRSVMGATKRLAEVAVAAAARQSGRRYVSVRFGNVLGSSGSVVPLFQRQLREGVPLTITDPEMTRYFMTIPEASRLILQASLFGGAGRPVRARHGRTGPDRRPRARPGPAGRPRSRLRPVPVHRPAARARSSTSRCSTRPRRSSRPTTPRCSGSARADEVAIDPAAVFGALDELVAIGASGDHAASRAALADDPGPPRPGSGAGRPRERRAGSRSIDRASAPPSATPPSRSSTLAG